MAHKSKKLVQKNKAHKDRSKPIGKKTKTTPKLNKKQTKIASKELRISQAKQRRDHTVKLNAESDYNLRGKNNSAPLLCGIFPLFEFNDTEVVFSLLKSTDPNAEIERIADIDNYRKLNTENFLMKSKKFKKNFSFVCCRNYRDRFDYLDLAKIVDWCLFILPDDLDELIGDYCEDLFASLFAQGLPSSCFLTLRNRDQFKLKDESKYFESITKIVLNDERIQCLSDANDAGKLMNYLANNCKPSYAASKKSLVDMKSIAKKRGYFLMQNLYFDEERNQLSLTGCMRGFGVDLDRTEYVHLTGIGDFPIKEAQWISPEESNRFNDTSVKKMKRVVIDHSATEKKSDLLLDGAHNDEEDLENDEEDLQDEEEDLENEEESDEEGMEMDEDEDEEEMVEDISDVDSDLDPADEKMSFATTAHSGYSTAQIQKFKESRENSMFPDEVEVAYWEKARDKFKKYRGLESFKRSEWPLTENLPNYYGQLHQFRKYQHDRNRLCNNLNRLQREQIANFIRAGSKFEMVLEKFSKNDYEKIDRILKDYPARHLVGSNLFTFEHRIGMFHFNERRIATVDNSVIDTLAKLEPNFDSAIELGEEANSHLEQIDPNLVLKPMEEPIKSKESMLFQVGFRRFSATPIYSEFTANSAEPGNKGKSKFLKFMPLHQAVVATGYGPVTFGPTPVLQFRIRQIDLEGAMDGEMSDPFVAELVATGSLLSIDTSRPIIKRVLLTGQIYKVHKRSVMIRYMFFNTEDIEHFKEIPLHTKSNKVGKIVRCHGTHGYMRCHFNKAVTQDEIPCMPLYKRVFPKYTVEKMYDYLPDKDHIDGENEAIWDPMDQLF